MSDITCSCGKEYYLEHIKIPIREKAETLRCHKCNRELYSVDKGTDHYNLINAEEKNESSRKKKEADYPKCDCGRKMVFVTGILEDFFECANSQNGCNKTVKIKNVW
ncbi:hypothetical protein [Bacillus toyonensis]|uniref:hypothetical protein n=1 Tax=Bacillus toyonensis TaxID=155322 RepID=UPI000BF0C43D|nr:hypothetical protein [Bacillus toyonensis]PEO34050.1 hypothetical protein CN569_12190 [Bacillus toyonensis]PGE77023.1 hypothetical protein COM70_12720 [Bacillus toyonensis]